jgi:hypothetical protein
LRLGLPLPVVVVHPSLIGCSAVLSARSYGSIQAQAGVSTKKALLELAVDGLVVKLIRGSVELEPVHSLFFVSDKGSWHRVRTYYVT